MKQTILLLFTALTCLSCGNRRRTEAQLEMLRSRPVVLSTERMRCLKDGLDTAVVHRDRALKFVVYTDSTVCASCRLRNMHLWDDFLEETAPYGDRLQLYFLFCPRTSDLRSLRIALRTYSPDCPVYVDTAHVFERANPHLPADEALHTFLLDADGTVLLAGSPLENEKINRLFHATVRKKLNGEAIR